MSRILWNEGWRVHPETESEAPFFELSRKNQEAGGYAARGFNDLYWDEVTLPHDRGMELPYFERASRSHGHFPTTSHEMDGEVPGRAAFTKIPTRIWYRKRFFAEKSWEDKRVIIEFEGAFRDTRVWINGQLFDRHESGYTGFKCDITDNLYYGGENVLAVCCDSRETEGWWYEGMGIYRNVFLTVKPEKNIDREDIRISADMYGSLSVSTDGLYGDEISWVLSKDGEAVLSGKGLGFSEKLDAPLLWSPDEPNLYKLTLALGTDTEVFNVGFRTFRFDADKGLFVNEALVKIKGCCVHQDFAGVGVALNDELNEYKIRRLKEMGANAYRSSHNAPSPAIVDACDRLGMLLMDETRIFGSTPSALNDMLALVRRDRTHPSVLMWSMGNEEHSVQNTEVGARMAKTVIKAVRALDDRTITYGGNNGENYDGVNAVSEVRGINYVHIRKYDYVDDYHAQHPAQPMYGSEEVSAVYTRGEYRGTREHVDAYGEHVMPWASTAEGWWKYYCERDFLAGGFIWTGFDYFGEPTPYERNVSTSFGAIDLCGFPKDVYYYYTAWWKKEPSLYLFPHWNFTPGESVRVVTYCNLDEVELFVNGVSMGRQQVEYLGHNEWTAVFEPGCIEAVAYRDGKAVLSQKRVTAEKPAQIHLSYENAVPGGKTRLIRAEITDENGITVPDADNLLSFGIEGGKLLGTGNGDPACREKNRFADEKVTREVTEWYKVEDGEEIPYEAFTQSTGEFYRIQTLASRWETEENKPPFRDSVRHVWRQVMNKTEARYAGYFDAVQGFDTIEFAMLQGAYTVLLNGKEIGSGENFGYPCAFRLDTVPGRNKIEVILKGTNAVPGIYNGVYLAGHKPAVWTRSAFHALALVIAEADDGAVIKAEAAGLNPATLKIGEEN